MFITACNECGNKSPKLSAYDIRFHTKKPRYQNITWSYRGGAAAPPLDWHCYH